MLLLVVLAWSAAPAPIGPSTPPAVQTVAPTSDVSGLDSWEWGSGEPSGKTPSDVDGGYTFYADPDGASFAGRRARVSRGFKDHGLAQLDVLFADGCDGTREVLERAWGPSKETSFQGDRSFVWSTPRTVASLHHSGCRLQVWSVGLVPASQRGGDVVLLLYLLGQHAVGDGAGPRVSSWPGFDRLERKLPDTLLRDIRDYQRRHPLSRGVIDGTFTEPELISRIEPRYPEGVVGRAGRCIVSAIVTREGRVKDPEVIESPLPALDVIVLRTVTHWQYRAATLDGKPVAAYVTIVVPPPGKR